MLMGGTFTYRELNTYLMDALYELGGHDLLVEIPTVSSWTLRLNSRDS